MIALDIKNSIAKYFLKKKRVINFEVGLNRRGRLRADILILAMNGHVTLVEVKSSLQDYRTDRKFHAYLDYCDKFYLAMPSSVFAKVKDEIPKGVGVFVVDPKVKVVKNATTLELSDDVRFNLIVRMAFRNAELNRHKHKESSRVCS